MFSFFFVIIWLTIVLYRTILYSVETENIITYKAHTVILQVHWKKESIPSVE
ncbi:MAG: hypothetical protein K0R05_3870 [Anaerocolumna sp.]|jgi:hypothetical protein|nr:hypothetical protein [Anaerocolumna sp.]